MGLLIKVWGNTYLNPACVGKIEFTQKSDNDKKLRTSTTTVSDLTGQHVLLDATSQVTIDYSTSTPAGRESREQRHR